MFKKFSSHSIFLLLIFLFLFFALQACSSGTATVPEPSPTVEQNQSLQVESPTFPLLSAESLTPGQNSYSYIASTGEEVTFLLHLPEDYATRENWPLIVFLHGSGSVGKTPDRIIDEGGLPAFVEKLDNFDFIVISPQLPSGRWGKYYSPIEELIVQVSEIVSVDDNRVYLTGLSLGATGVWQYALEYPDRFAAIVPIAGAANPSSTTELVPDNICTLMNLGIWVFNGEEDKYVRPEVAEAIASALEACGAEVKLTIYPGAGHSDSWNLAYAEPDLYDWLREQSK